jgi:hypothetical protein
VNSVYLLTILIFLFFTIYIWVITTFLYNIYEFATKIPNSCPCVDTWQKYIIYGQGILYSFSSIIIIGLVFGIIRNIAKK